MDLRDPDIWISHLLENLPEDKLGSALKDNNPDWEYIDGEMLKFGSLAHNQLDIPQIQRRGLMLLATESKDFRLLTHLLRTLQHAGHPLLALRLLALYVEHFWMLAAPQNAVHKQRLAAQVIKRLEAGVESFAENSDTPQHNCLLAELAKLAQCWQEHNVPMLAKAMDELSSQYRRAFHRAVTVQPAPPSVGSPPPINPPPSLALATTPAITAIQTVNIESHDDKAWRDTLLKVAAILCERQPDSPQGYRLRRHALWQAITSLPQAESDGRTPLAAVPADMIADYQNRLNNADLALWQQIEKSLLLAPYWFDGHHLSAQTAQRLGYTSVAEAIRDELARFLARLPKLASLLFNDRTPFMSEQTKQWVATYPDTQPPTIMRADENTEAVRQCFSEQGLEAALQYLEKLPEGEPRDWFLRQYLGAQLIEDAGMVQLAQQQYRMLFKTGLRMTLRDWEPSLLEQLEKKFTAEKY